SAPLLSSRRLPDGSSLLRISRRLLIAAAWTLAASPWTVAQPQPPAPTPESVLGWEPCADYKLATYEQIEAYFRALAAAVPQRMKLVEMGRTTEGRTQVMAIISSEQNLRQLDRYKEISQRLARARALSSSSSSTAPSRRAPDDRLLTDQEAQALARDGKAVVWIDFGLHSSEVAHGQTAPLMAFKAATDESDEMRFIRDQVIFILVANMNPDGTTMVASWYRENLGKPWESRLPDLWHKY